jgi:hypothetical protein
LHDELHAGPYLFFAAQFSILRRPADRTHSITLVAFAGRNIAVWVAENEKAPANAEAYVMKLKRGL